MIPARRLQQQVAATARSFSSSSLSTTRHHKRPEETVSNRLVQINYKGSKHVALVGLDNDTLHLLKHTPSSFLFLTCVSVYGLANDAIQNKKTLLDLAIERLSLSASDVVQYDEILESGQLFNPIDHPNPRHLWVTGTGLVHFEKADSLVKMNARPNAGQVDAKHATEAYLDHQHKEEKGKHKHDREKLDPNPDWFFKGDGHVVVAPGQALQMPDFSQTATEEMEMVGIYLNDAHGIPHRLGFTLGNEFSDHTIGGHHAHNKLRPCSIGPELFLGDLPADIKGKVRIVRNNNVAWSASFLSGQRHLAHSLDILEHSHFKHMIFRRPGDVHAHFLGSSIVSFSQGFRAQPGDVFELEADIFARPLRNKLEKAPAGAVPPSVKKL